MTKFVGIISAKGGVGKTTTAINLGSALDVFKREVIVLDANFSNPNIGLHLGFKNNDKTIHSALRGEHSIKHAITKHHTGLKVIPGGLSFEDSYRVKRANLVDVINQLTDYAEVVVIDSTAGLGENCKAVISASDYLILITSPDLISVADSLRLKRLVQVMQKKILGVIVNRVEGLDYEMTIPNIEVFLEEKVIGVIPEDKNIGMSLKHRSTVVHKYPYSPASIAFKKTAALLIGQKYSDHIEEEEKKSMFYYMLRNMGMV
ncbi:MAG: cell division ATPase MinD [Candidatus Woesearchaeota archaeon]